jgi:hypothetical protein
MNKQTAVEWVELELKKLPFVDVVEVFQKAKAMEKEQIIKAFCEGYDHDGDNYDGAEISYYNRTYKGGDK